MEFFDGHTTEGRFRDFRRMCSTDEVCVGIDVIYMTQSKISINGSFFIYRLRRISLKRRLCLI